MSSVAEKPVAVASRRIARCVTGMPTEDGAGVKLTRLVGQPQLSQVDPILMLDVFRSDDAKDYIAGFPEHPHRGFETVSYMVKGSIAHRDNQNDRRDAPGDPGHRQEGSQFITKQAFEHLPYELGQVGHGFLTTIEE